VGSEDAVIPSILLSSAGDILSNPGHWPPIRVSRLRGEFSVGKCPILPCDHRNA
jgi:hypothetical protein